MRLIFPVFLSTVITLLAQTTRGQALVQPSVFTQPAPFGPFAAAPPAGGGSEQQLFSSGDIALPVYDKSQFGASSRVYTVSVYGTPKCHGSGSQQVCVSRYWFRLSVDANVVSAVLGQASAIREYVFSQKGSPLALTLPIHTWTTKKGDVRQTWFAFSPSGSGRFIPVSQAANNLSNSNNSSNLSGGGSVSLAATGEAHIEFDATEPGSDPNGTDTTYPGTLYLSVTPTFAATLGGPLKASIFQGSPTANWVWGGEYRAGFQFKGKKPISLGITGTFSAKGLTSSNKGIAISLSKLFGGSR